MTTVSFDLVAYDKGSKAFDKMADSGAKLNTQLTKLDKTTATATVNVDGSKAENSIAKFGGQLKKLDKATATAQVNVDTTKAEGSFAKFGPKMAAGAAIIGVAAGAALTKSFTEAMDTQSALKKLDAQLGASAFDSQKHGKVAGKLFADAYGESMGDVTDAIKSVIQNIGGMRDATEDELRAISAMAIDTAEVIGEDVAALTRAVSQMLRTGMAESAEEAFDILVFGVEKGVNASEDLLDTFGEYSTQFRSLGLNGKAALGILRQGLEGGARDADIVADAMKELNIRVSDKSAAAALKELGLNADRMAEAFAKGGPKAFAALDMIMDKLRAVKNPTDQYRLAQQLLGTQAEDLGDALQRIDPSTAVEGMDDLAGSTQRAGATMADTADNKITHWWRTAKQKIVDFIGAEAIPKLEELIQKFDFSQIVTQVEQIAAKLDELWDTVFADIAEWAENNRAQIETFMTDTEAAVEDFSGAITAAIDFLTAVWDHGGKEIFGIAFATLQNVLNIITGFMQQIQGVFQVATGILTLDWDLFWQGIRNIGEGMIQVVSNVLDGAMRLIVSSWGGNWDEMKRQARDKFGEIVGDVKNGINTIIKAWNWLSSKLGLPTIALLDIRTAGAGGGGGFLERMASGGVVPGMGNRDSVPALLTPGEVVFSKLAIENLGGLRVVDTFHTAARQGRSGFERLFGGDPSEPGLAYFADGGAVARTQAFGRSQAGKPYIWGGVGPRGFDCSGLASALTQVALGRADPFRRLFATGSFTPGNGAGYFQPGLTSAFSVGVVRGNPGHMSTTVGGLNIEATPPVVRVGPGARGADHSSFNMRFSLPQVGGQFVGGGGGLDLSGLVRNAFGSAFSAADAIGRLGGVFGSGASAIVRTMADNVMRHLLSQIPGFAHGGVVPGPYGSPRLVTAHGGEAVLGLGWEQRLTRALVTPRSTVENHYHLSVQTQRSERTVRDEFARMEHMAGG